MIVTKRESMASLIHDTSPTLCLVHHAVYCISLSCLLSFLCNPYIPFLIYKIFHLLVIIIIAIVIIIVRSFSFVYAVLYFIAATCSIITSQSTYIHNNNYDKHMYIRI